MEPKLPTDVFCADSKAFPEARMWISIKRFIKAGVLALWIGACINTPPEVALAADQNSTDITFLLTSDVYKMSAENGRGGLARIAAVLKNEKASHSNVLAVHAGDTLSPSLMSSFDQGAHIVELFNMTPLDIFVPGNHEFDFGPDVFLKRMGSLKAGVLAANLDAGTVGSAPFITPSRIVSFGNVKIGVIGLTDEDSAITSKPGKITFRDSLATATAEASRLRKQGADLIVIVAHAGRPRDDALFASGVADLILSGHDHDLYMRFNEKTAIAEAGEDGMAVVAVDLKVSVETKADGQRRVRWWPRFRFIDTADAAPDAAVEARVRDFEGKLDQDLNIPAGQTTTELDSRNAAVRGGEAAIGNLVSDAVREATRADVVLLNGGGFRGGRLYPAGTVLTRKDVLGELPFLNKAYVLSIKGADILKALEQGFTGAEDEIGRFPQVSGMTIRADLTRPAGRRVVSVKIGGKALQRAATYTLATNDYLAHGGDGYSALTAAKVLRGEQDADLVTTIAIQYLERHKTVSPHIEGRIVVARSRPPH
jgi:2',3'-cyclic-nucleotide 2'-phosphodiesterase (5'-nucleotidase family)